MVDSVNLIFGADKKYEKNKTEKQTTVQQNQSVWTEDNLSQEEQKCGNFELFGFNNKLSQVELGKKEKLIEQLDPEKQIILQKRNLLADKYSHLKAEDLEILINLENSQWRKILTRELLTDKNPTGKPFSTKDAAILSKVSKEDWLNILESDILTKNDLTHSFSTEKLVTYAQKDINAVENVLSDLLYLKKMKENPKNIRKLCEYYNENPKVPYFYLYEKTKEAKPRIIEANSDYPSGYVSSLASEELSDKEYEDLNENLYGKKSPEIQKLFDDFKKKYPDIKLMVDNDVSLRKAKEIIKSTEEFVDYQRKSNIPFSKIIQFTKIDNAGGFCFENKIVANIKGNEMTFLHSLTHENGHFKDNNDMGYVYAEIPRDIQNILKKLLRDYAATNTLESIADLAAAIETPNDKDFFRMTNKIRLRKDENGNSVLMVAKNSNITKEEVDKLGEYYRSIICPELIPDYDLSKHGLAEDYNETVIRDESKVKQNLERYFTSDELTVINERNLLSSEYLKKFGIPVIKYFARLDNDIWQNIIDRELLSKKNAENKPLSHEDIAYLAYLSKEEWKNVIDRDLLKLKNANDKAFSGMEINLLSQFTKEDWKNTIDRELLSKKNSENKPLSPEDIYMLSWLSDISWNELVKQKMLSQKASDCKALPIWVIAAKAHSLDFKNCIDSSLLSTFKNTYDKELNEKSKFLCQK